MKEVWKNIRETKYQVSNKGNIKNTKTENDLNIWTCGVRGPRVKGKSIKGYLLPTELFFNIQPVDNPFVTIEHQ